jgi:hypothetical protein
MTNEQNRMQYSKVVDWARRRYTVAGVLVVRTLAANAGIGRASISCVSPAPFSAIENLAWARYFANACTQEK